MWSKIKGWVGLIVALAIPTVLAGFFYFSEQQANKEVAEYQKYQKAHPQIENITVDNYELKEIGVGNVIKWRLKAKRGTLESSTHDVNLEEVRVQCYDDQDKLKMTLCAPSGLTNEDTRLVHLASSHGTPVMCEGASGAKLQAPKVELTKKNQFIASGGVTIVYPGVAKVTGSTATGSVADSADLKNFKINGNTHAIIGHI
jgi:hypothetical protein